MDGDEPGLAVGFAIDAGGSFEVLRQLEAAMDTTEARIVREAASIERATGGMINLGGATAQVTTFGNESTRAAQKVVRETAQIERAGERLVRQLTAQNDAFGKSRSELRLLKAEETALAAERVGNSDLAQRLREQEARALALVNVQMLERNRLEAALERTMGSDRPRATDAGATFSALAARAAEEEAIAKDAAAAASARLAREHRELAAAVQGSHAAQMADAAAAERLRRATDPLYAATSRLNAEIAESTRLYLAGATAPAEYARQQEVLTGRLRDVTQQHARVNGAMSGIGGTGKLAGHTMQNLAFQFQDLGVQMAAAAGSSDPLKMAMMALMQQGAQIQGIMSQAGIGIRGVGAAFASMSKSILVATATNPYLLAAAAAIGVFVGAVKLLQSAANDDRSMEAYAKSLGLTAKEIRNLDDVTVTFGDTAKAIFQVTGRAIWDSIGPAVTSAWGVMKEWIAWIFTGVKAGANYLVGSFVGGYQAIVATWRMFPAAMGDLFIQSVNKAIEGINFLIAKSVAGINFMVDQANKILPDAWKLERVSAGTVKSIENQWDGAASNVAKVWEEKVGAALSVDYLGNAGDAFAAQAVKNAEDRLKAQALEKGYLDPEKGKTDRTGERLARENGAIEAQIRNLYALAGAYRVSGAAALVAEARVKAESDAIKKRGDIDVFVNRQIRLAIAERVVDAVKAAAADRELAAATAAVNAQVAAGLIPAERAAELTKDRIADLPLLAAIEVAQQRGLAGAAAAATVALEDQRKAREALRAAEATAKFNAAMAQGGDQLATLREELRLVGATNSARNEALALLKATQEAARMGFSGEEAKAYIANQVDIATATERLTIAQAAFNQELSFTADKWALIAQNVQDAASGMADAFGQVGRAIGDVASIYASYQANRARLDLQHKEEMKRFTGNVVAQEREREKYALATATSQIGLYGDMAAAAKGFFKEKSAGWQALMAIEKIYRAFEFAMSVRAMAQDMAETLGMVANSAARATAAGAEGVATQSKLPFPFNIVAMAATGAALLAAGISLLGSGGGGAVAAPTSPEDLQKAAGSGSILGDSRAQSNSIANSLEIMASNSNSNLEYSNQMLRALKAIESGIGNLAGVIARQITVSGSMFDTSGLNIGQSGSNGFLGLFGSSTTRSLYDAGIDLAARTVGDIVAQGITGSTYQIVQQVRRTSGFLGIGGGTRTTYQTTTGAIDGDITAAIVDVIASLRAGLIEGADQLGIAGAQALLDSFQVNIGRVSFQGMTGEEIENQLNAIFSRVGDDMASRLYPQLAEMQQIGEGAFETFMRVARQYQVVDTALASIGRTFGAVGLGSVQARDALIQLFGTMDEFVERTSFFAEKFLTDQERLVPVQAAVSAELARLGLSQIATMEQFKNVVLGLDLTSEAGREMYAALMALAPAFAMLHQSASQVLSERADLERRILELQGNTAALRALELSKLDASNRALQQQIWAMEDAQEASRAAEELRKAWASVGDGIMEEVRRIRGITGSESAGGFASAQGQFNAAVAAAQGGDLDAARSLPGLSQTLLRAAELQATSRQELDRIRAQTAATLEQLFATINGAAPPSSPTVANSQLSDAAAAAQIGTTGQDNFDLADEVRGLREEVAGMRAETRGGLMSIASATGSTARSLDRVTLDSGGDAISTRAVG